MEDKKNIVPEKKSSEIDQLEDEEDLLYTHKSEARGNEMRWNSSLCRKSGR
ncbi:MAG: hypothetical protein AAGU10_07795 [Methanosarcina mazei]|jgi:hypothetical protein|uniref:hypothetical protein n=1 Tax=Methanosarcina soligelidi TaxID=1036677 RepID=UPI000A4CA82E|nr:hypothetical protein [Methanosarcina soligelidi]